MSLPATLRGLILALAVAPAFARAAPADALPPIQFNGTVAGDELYNLLKADPPVRESQQGTHRLSDRAAGHAFLALTSGGKASAFGSAIWAGGTLGLLPVVTNNDLVITYDLVVNGTVLATHAYQRNFTRAVNIWRTIRPTDSARTGSPGRRARSQSSARQLPTIRSLRA